MADDENPTQPPSTYSQGYVATATPKVNTQLTTQNNYLAIARAVIATTPGLGKSLVPVLKELSELGFNQRQLEALIEVPSVDGLSRHGRGSRMKHFLGAVNSVYDPAELANAANNPHRYLKLLDELGDAQHLRSDLHEMGFNVSYKLAIRVLQLVGAERTIDMFEDLRQASIEKDKPIHETAIPKKLIGIILDAEEEDRDPSDVLRSYIGRPRRR